jgi:hypothetical protein
LVLFYNPISDRIVSTIFNFSKRLADLFTIIKYCIFNLNTDKQEASETCHLLLLHILQSSFTLYYY